VPAVLSYDCELDALYIRQKLRLQDLGPNEIVASCQMGGTDTSHQLQLTRNFSGLEPTNGK